MATPTSKGVYVRPRRAWNLDTLAGAVVNLPGSAGNFATGVLVNDSQPAVNLAIYGLSLWQQNANDTVHVYWFNSIPAGATLVSNANPVIAGGAIVGGSMYSLQTPSHFGTTILELGGEGQWFFHLDDTPLIVLPPKYTLLFQSGITGQAAVYSAIWGAI